jgi:hypothetical protein
VKWLGASFLVLGIVLGLVLMSALWLGTPDLGLVVVRPSGR